MDQISTFSPESLKGTLKLPYKWAILTIILFLFPLKHLLKHIKIFLGFGAIVLKVRCLPCPQLTHLIPNAENVSLAAARSDP